MTHTMALTLSTLSFDSPEEFVKFVLLSKANPGVSEIPFLKGLFETPDNSALLREPTPKTAPASTNNTVPSMASTVANLNQKRRGRPSAAFAPTTVAPHSPAQPTKKPRHKSKLKDGFNLTKAVKQSIEHFIAQQQAFTAQSVYEVLLTQGHEDINKFSVVASVQKQMDKDFPQVDRCFEAGKGPRPKKVYKP